MRKETILEKLIATPGPSELEFQRLVRQFYSHHGRSFPWRSTRDSYEIFVSELMLQQTQTERVVPKYEEFIKLFPTWRFLAAASLTQVLKAWEGLGYYRRARNLHRAAAIVVAEYSGRTPETLEGLKSLPGVGTYTAAAVCAFAFCKPVTMLETNIRTVYLECFFAGRQRVTDAELLPIIERTCFTDDPRSWYYGLMDIGAFLKQHVKGVQVTSAHYKKQSSFLGSTRQVRAAILRFIVNTNGATPAKLQSGIPFSTEKIDEVIKSLLSEGFLMKERGKYRVV